MGEGTRRLAETLTALGKVDLSLVLFLGDSVRLLVGESSTDSTGLLVSKVKWEV